jgi:hypothetical protein
MGPNPHERFLSHFVRCVRVVRLEQRLSKDDGLVPFKQDAV